MIGKEAKKGLSDGEKDINDKSMKDKNMDANNHKFHRKHKT
jgi:hypothetical protein